MRTSKDWGKLTRRMEQLMRLKSFPIALKMLEKKTELEKIPFLRRPKHKMTLCQLTNLVRNFDWTVGADKEGLSSPTCRSILGLAELPEFYRDGTFRSIVWVSKKEEGKKYEESIPHIPPGKYEAAALAPLAYNPIDPDMILLYANPAQMMLLINSLQFQDYEVMNFHCVGESSCADAIARCYLTRKPSLSIPCYGERRYGHAQDDELVMALPAEMLEKALSGMEALYRRGVRYPISFAGAETDLSRAFPPAYQDLAQREFMAGTARPLLLAVTGGAASGKSTVAGMLEELGAPLIDFDDLSRRVIEPEKPAWRQIVAYFGEQVLQADRRLDSRKLAELARGDMEKGKKLDGFIQPRIKEELENQVKQMAARNPGDIIQVVFPRLLELNLQYQFDKVLLVYVPRETQMERLMTRQGMSPEAAAQRLNSEWPMEEKKKFAHFVIHNEGSREETRKQVEEIWRTLASLRGSL